jgi:hypothetical protein
VQARIEQLRPTLRVRLGRWFGVHRERFGGGMAVAFAMAAAAVLTIVITTPFARNMVGANHATQLTTRDARALARDTAKSSAAIASATSGEPSTIISKLESSNPDVAVWSEPSQDTTVIWLPDQQP